MRSLFAPASGPRTLSPDAVAALPSREGPAAACYPFHARRLVRTAPRSVGRCFYRPLQPTTDTCTRSSFDSRFGLRRDAARSRGPPLRDCLSASRSRVKARLTPRLQLRQGCLRRAAALALASPGLRGPLARAACLRRSRPQARWTAGLWRPVRDGRLRREPAATDARAPPASRSSKRAAFGARNAFHRQVPSARSRRTEGPPPCSRLCRHRAGFRRRFTLRPLAREGLDPSPRSCLLGGRAGRRLSTSAIDTTTSTTTRPLEPRPPSARSPAPSARPKTPGQGRLRAAGGATRHGWAGRDLSGQGRSRRDRTSPGDRSPQELDPNPLGPGHLSSRARCEAGLEDLPREAS